MDLMLILKMIASIVLEQTRQQRQGGWLAQRMIRQLGGASRRA